MKGLKKLGMWILVIVFLLSPVGCATPVVEAASVADEKVNGLTDKLYWELFPPDYNVVQMIDWSKQWNPPGGVGRAPSEAEVLEMYVKWAGQNGLIFVNEDAKATSMKVLAKPEENVTLVPAVTETGTYAFVGTMALKSTGTLFKLGTLNLAPAISVGTAVLIGAVTIAGVVYLAYVGYDTYMWAKTHTHKTHAPDSIVGRQRINLLKANKGKGPDEKCFKMTMDYLVKDAATGKMVQGIRYGFAQKIVGSNYGNSWLWGVYEVGKWVTVYPVTGDLTKTSSLTKFVEVISCALMPPMPPTP